MLKKTLPAAIALAAGLGLAGAANAVNVNHDGTGQVLIYDWYTVEDGIDTLISITNTTSEAVALKVRFVEAMNSQEVLDFNLYLSPYDMWTGNVAATADGAELSTSDNSCTVPAINGPIPFRNFQYVGSDYSNSEGGPQGLDRTRTGYLEIIEMGVLLNESVNPAAPAAGEFNPAYYATHAAGVPADCASLVAGWGAGGAWTAMNGRAVDAPAGGQYGLAAHVDVANGTATAVDTVALDNFFFSLATEADPLSSDTDLHRAPGSVNPSLADATAIAVLPNGATVAPASGFGIDAVSIVLMMEALMNDYVTVASILSSTDWIITFPTKRFYVNGWTADANGNPDNVTNVPGNNPEPFTSFWTDAAVGGVEGSSCETIGISYWDREEGVEAPNPLDFSPQPPGPSGFALCYEANILSINGSDIAGGGYTRSNLDLSSGFDAGWMRLSFTGAFLNANGDTYTRAIALAGGGSVLGLPTIGHSKTEFLNSGAGGAGVLANYQYESKHKAQVTVITSGN